MNKIRFNFKHHVLRTLMAGVALFGTTNLLAQEVTEDAPSTQAAQAKTTPKAPQAVRKEVKGRVLNASTKAPLAGVSVRAFNMVGFSAFTDDNGNFSIKVPEFTTSLYFTCDGFNPVQQAIKSGEELEVELNSSLTKKYYKPTMSLVNSASAELDQTSAQSFENDVDAKLNASMRMVSRGGIPAMGAFLAVNGLNSLNSNAQPLVIVDGVMWDMQYSRESIFQGFYNNVFNTIDPEDIESVEVIKNGTALYGAKGANGVLKINTKRGKDVVTKINIRVFGGFEQTPSLTKMMNAGQYRNFVTEFLGTTEYGKSLSRATDVPFLNEDPNYLYYPMFHQDVDWQKDLYHTAFTQNYKVSVEGGDDVAMYNLSLGYTQGDATAKKTNFNRLNIRFNTDINMFANLLLGLDIAYSRSAYNLRDNGWAPDYSEANISSPNVLGLLQSPFVSPYYYFIRYDQGLGKLVPDYSTSVYAGKVYDDPNGINPLAFASRFGYEGLANPYWILKNGHGENKNYQEQTQFSINVNPRYSFSRALTLSDRFSYVLNRTNEKYYFPRSGTPAKEVEGLGDVTSAVKTQFGKQTSIFNDLRLDWKKQMGAHFLNAFGGFRYTSFTYTNSYMQGFNNDQDKMPNMAYSLQYKSAGGLEDNWTNLAWYLSASYNYKNIYFLDVTGTMETSSRFGDKAKGGLELAGVRWGLFPSVQAGWLISSEDWFRVKGVDHLKLIAGFEMTGNDDVDYYASRTYYQNVKFMDKATALVLANIANPEIKWETTYRYNVGLQTSLLKNRLMVGFNYFWANTKDLLTRKSVSDITGLGFMWTNEGKLKNTGLDLSVDAVIVNSKNFKWQAGFTVGHYHNEITALPKSELNTLTTYALDANGNRDEATKHTFEGYTSNIYGRDNVLTAVGRPVGVFYGYASNGVFASDAEASQAGKFGYLRYPTGLAEQPYRNFKAGDLHFVDQNGDGWISEADMVVIGNPNPDIYGNFYTKFNWKHFQLDALFKYSLGNDIFNYQRQQLESANSTWNQTRAVVNRWRYDGHETDVPRTMCNTNDEWVNNERFSDRWIEDGSFLKLKKVRLTYTLPLELEWLRGLSVWGEVNNVFTVTKYLGQDPEVSVSNGVLYQGVDAGMLPSNRSFNVGLTINL